MKRVMTNLSFAIMLWVFHVQAQTPPILTAVTSDQPAKGMPKRPGLAINLGRGPVLTFYGSNFSNNMVARFTTINLKGLKGTLDIAFEQTFAEGEQDSGKVKLDALKKEHLIIASGPVYLYDTVTGLRSADAVNIVVVPSVFSILDSPADLPFEGRHQIKLTSGETLYLEGSGLVQDSTALIFPKIGGGTLRVKPLAVGSAISMHGGDDYDFRADTLDEGLMAQFVVPAEIGDSGGIAIETHSGISAPYFYKKPQIEIVTRFGPPLRGAPADPTKLSVNVDDTLQFFAQNLGDTLFPSLGPLLSIPVQPFSGDFLKPFSFIASDLRQARAIVPAEMVSGNPAIFNVYSHGLKLFKYYVTSSPGPFVQVVPTLDSLKSRFSPFFAPGNDIVLYGGGFRQSNGQRALVKFAKAGGGTTISLLVDELTPNQLQVRIPIDAAPGEVYVETEGGRSNSLSITFSLKPLEIIAIANKGLPRDPSQPSANYGQTIVVKSQGIKSTTRFRYPITAVFYNDTFVSRISADGMTAEVRIESRSHITGLVQLYDETTGSVTEAKLLQIVPTLSWVSSPDFAPGNDATLHGSALYQNAAVTFTDSSGAESEAEIRTGKNDYSELTVTLPPRVADGWARVTTNGGRDSLSVKTPVLTQLTVIAERGTPTDPSIPSANIGQVMIVDGQKLSNDVVVRFPTDIPLFVDLDLRNVAAGVRGEVTVGSLSGGGANIATGAVRLGVRNSSNRSFPPLVSSQGLPLQVVPTLTSIEVLSFTPGQVATLSGSGFGENQTKVFFSNSSGNFVEGQNVDVVTSGLLRVTLPEGAVPGPVTVQTNGGTSLPLIVALKPLEIIATATKGRPADPSQASANFGQTITVKSEGIASTTRLRVPIPPAFNNILYPVKNISPDGKTAEVTLNDDRHFTGLVQLVDQTTGLLSEARLLQIVPTLAWVSSPGFAPGKEAILHGSSFIPDSTAVTFTDSTGGVKSANILSFGSHRATVTVRLPEKVAEGLVRVSTRGGRDSLLVQPPVLSKLHVMAQKGTPNDPTQPSANIGQVMGIEGKNLTGDTDVRFTTVNQFGNTFSIDLDLLNVMNGTRGELTVGSASVNGGLLIATGEVKLATKRGTFLPLVSAQALTLQIVPTLSGFDVARFAPGQVATLRGSGLAEKQTKVFFSDSSGHTVEGLQVDVVGDRNNELRVTLPPRVTNDPITVRTNGGASLPFTILPPQITSISPNQAIRGAALQMTLTGKNFSIGSGVRFSGAGITVDTTAFLSPTQLFAALRIEVNASLDTRDVIVTNPSGQSHTLLAALTIVRDQQAPMISQVTQLPNTGDVVGPYLVQARITDNVDVKTAYLVFSANDFAVKDSFAMSLIDSQHYHADIPGQPLSTTVKYFVSAFDFEGNRTVDPLGALTTSYSFQVLPIPVFRPIADQMVEEAQPLSFKVHATDTNNDPITFSVANLPRGATFIDSTFSWTPDYTQSGNYAVTFTADDNHDGASTLKVKIVVKEIDDPPVVRGPSNRTAFVGQLLEIPISITDPDRDALTITYLDQPAGSTIHDPGTSIKFFRWKPAPADVGTYNPKFIASDGLVADTLAIAIVVSQPPGPLVESVNPTFGHVGDMVKLKGIAFGQGSGVVLFNNVPAAAVITGDTTAMVIVPPGAESGPLILVSSDGKSGDAKFFTVLPPPTVNLVARSLGASVPLVLAGNSLTLKARIENNGAFAARTKITFYDDHPDSGGVALGAPLLFDIAANDQTEMALVWTPRTPGIFFPYARISGAEPRETKLFDNTVADDVVMVIAPGIPELVTLYAPPEEFIVGRSKNYRISLLNSGSETAQVNAITVAGDFGFVPITALPFALVPGIVRTFDFTVTLPTGTAPGDHSTIMRVATAKGNEFTGEVQFLATEDNPEITVRLRDDRSGLTVAGARVFADGLEQSPTTINGEARFKVATGTTLDVVFFKEGYLPARGELSAEGGSRTVNVFIKPGEILVTSVEVKPLSSEEIAQLGLDLNDAANFDYYHFSATLRFSPDAPPVKVDYFASASEPTSRCGDREIKGNLVSFTEELETNPDPEVTDCHSKFTRVLQYTYDNGETCTLRKPLIPTEYRVVFVDEKEDCNPFERKLIKEEQLEVRGITCTHRVYEVCRKLPKEDKSERPLVVGGAENPAPGVTIPYALVIDGQVRTLKEFFNVALAVGNQADPSFTVTGLEVELTSSPVGAVSVVKDAEPLPDLRGGQSASTTWVVRGDAVGTHEVQIKLTGTLQPGNIPLSTTQFAFITVNEPPQLEVVLQHPERVENGQAFILSAVVTNRSENTVARQSSIEIFLDNRSTSELLSETRQDLGEIPPGQTSSAIWSLVARGSGKIHGCNQSSGGNLGFTLLIGDQPCEDLLPSDTEKDEDVPVGKVVIIGTDVPLPNVEVTTVGTDKDGRIRRVTAITDKNGLYKFPKRIHGDNLEFSLFPQGLPQQAVRGFRIKIIKPVARDASEMPTLELGAVNQYVELNKIIASLLDTETTDEFFALLAKEYENEEIDLKAFLNTEEEQGTWGANLNQTREEFFRLFLAQELLARARLDAKDMALVSSDKLGRFVASLVHVAIFIRHVKHAYQLMILKQHPTIGADWIERVYLRIYHGFAKILASLLASNPNLAIKIIQIPVSSGDFVDNAIDLGAHLGLHEFISLFERAEGLQEFFAKKFIKLYAEQTDDVILEMNSKALDYNLDRVRPVNEQSLVFSFHRVADLSRDISFGASEARKTADQLAETSEFLGKVNIVLSGTGVALAAASASPAAPVTLTALAVLRIVKLLSDLAEIATGIGAMIPAPNQLFIEIPAKLHEGVNAAFNSTGTTSALHEQISVDFPERHLMKTGSAVFYNQSVLSQNLSEAIRSYQDQLQIVRDLVARDSINAAVAKQVGQFLPASDNLGTVLSQIEALLEGASVRALSQRTSGADSLLSAYTNSLVQFHASNLELPWRVIHYSLLGEFENGASNPDYATTKQEMLNLLDKLDRRAGDLEGALLSALAQYEAQGLVLPTAVVDSLWFTIDGQISLDVLRVPAKIAVNARARNLSPLSLSGLKLTLRTGSPEGLSFDSGMDSTLILPQLAPADNIPGGADEFIASWSLTYKGSLATREGLALSAVLSSDSVNVHTASSKPALLYFHRPDTDDDGMPDDYERAFAFDPNRNEAAEDPDRDQASNLQEYLLGTHPKNPDSDADGILDGVEVSQGSDPLNPASPAGAGAVALAFPLTIEVKPDTIFRLPVSISSGSPVTFVQFTVDYDSTLLKFESASLDSGLLSFTLDTVNTNPGFVPSTPGTNKNVLVQISSANSALTGNGKQVAVLSFTAIAAQDTTTRLSFNRRADHTKLRDQDNLPLRLASFTDATITVTKDAPQITYAISGKVDYFNVAASQIQEALRSKATTFDSLKSTHRFQTNKLKAPGALQKISREYEVESAIKSEFFNLEKIALINRQVQMVEMILSGDRKDTTRTDETGAYRFAGLRPGLNLQVTPVKAGDIGALSVTCFDAALIAQQSIGLITLNPQQQQAADVDENGKIQFFDAALTCRYAVGFPPFSEQDHTGAWRFVSPFRSYPLIGADQLDQDYTALVLGDIDASWQPDAGTTLLAKENASHLRFNDKLEWSDDKKHLTTSLIFDGALPALAFNLDLTYDPKVLRSLSVSCLLQDWQFVENNTGIGRLRLGMYSTQPYGATGEIIVMKWEVLDPKAAITISLDQALVNRERQNQTGLTLPSALPTRFALHQNYPNPFNPETVIRFDIPQVTGGKIHTRVAIYNTLGQLVKVLMDEKRAPGYHQVLWNGRNESGSPVATGVYFYTISAGDFKARRKMLLVK